MKFAFGSTCCQVNELQRQICKNGGRSRSRKQLCNISTVPSSSAKTMLIFFQQATWDLWNEFIFVFKQPPCGRADWVACRGVGHNCWLLFTQLEPENLHSLPSLTGSPAHLLPLLTWSTSYLPAHLSRPSDSSGETPLYLLTIKRDEPLTLSPQSSPTDPGTHLIAILLALGAQFRFSPPPLFCLWQN